jgi:hypothetical protein
MTLSMPVSESGALLLCTDSSLSCGFFYCPRVFAVDGNIGTRAFANQRCLLEECQLRLIVWLGDIVLLPGVLDQFF